MMSNGKQSVLVVYATWTGVTRQVAEAVARRLESDGASVTVAEADKVKEIAAYDAVVIGYAVHGGKLPKQILAFTKRFAGELAHKAVAWFLMSLTMVEDTPEHRQIAMGYLDTARRAAPAVEPVAIGLFAGTVLQDTQDYKQLFPLYKFIVNKFMQSGLTEHRDWNAIDAWAASLLPLFEGVRVAAAA